MESFFTSQARLIDPYSMIPNIVKTKKQLSNVQVIINNIIIELPLTVTTGELDLFEEIIYGIWLLGYVLHKMLVPVRISADLHNV